eukprot:gene5726-7909_t
MIELPTLKLRQAALEQLGETPELRDRSLRKLRSLIEKLPKEEQLANRSDENLIRFLRGKKFDVKLAFKVICCLVKFNHEHPEWTNDLTVEEFTIFSNLFEILENYDHAGRLVIIVKSFEAVDIFTTEFMKNNPNALIRFNIWLFDRVSRVPNVQVYGITLVNTFIGFSMWDSLTIVSAYPLDHQVQTFHYLQDCCSIRLGGVYVFNEPMFVNVLWSMLRYMLAEKLRDRFHFCRENYDSLKSAININYLPLYLGGNLRTSFDWISMMKNIEEELFKSDVNYYEKCMHEKLAIISDLSINMLSISMATTGSADSLGYTDVQGDITYLNDDINEENSIIKKGVESDDENHQNSIQDIADVDIIMKASSQTTVG